MKRILILAGAVGLLFAVIVWWFWPTEWLTDDLLIQVKIGMTLDEVKSVLGEPVPEDEYPHRKLGDFDMTTEETIDLLPRDSRLPIVEVGPGYSIKRRHLTWLTGSSYIWLGKHRMVVVITGIKWDNPPDVNKWNILSDTGRVENVRVYPITRSGGGFWDWFEYYSQRLWAQGPKGS